MSCSDPRPRAQITEDLRMGLGSVGMSSCIWVSYRRQHGQGVNACRRATRGCDRKVHAFGELTEPPIVGGIRSRQYHRFADVYPPRRAIGGDTAMLL